MAQNHDIGENTIKIMTAVVLDYHNSKVGVDISFKIKTMIMIVVVLDYHNSKVGVDGCARLSQW